MSGLPVEDDVGEREERKEKVSDENEMPQQEKCSLEVHICGGSCLIEIQNPDTSVQEVSTHCKL